MIIIFKAYGTDNWALKRSKSFIGEDTTIGDEVILVADSHFIEFLFLLNNANCKIRGDLLFFNKERHAPLIDFKSLYNVYQVDS